MRTRTHRRLHLLLFATIPSCMCVRVDIKLHACMDGSVCTGVHRCTCICIYISVYIYNDVYIPVMYLLCTYMHACMWVCTDTLHTQVSMRVCVQADATPIDGVHVYSLAIGSAKYIMCMDISLYLDACTSERRRGARAGVQLRRVRARMRPRWAASASGYSRRSERTGVPIAGRTRARCAAGPSPPRR
jgi:hypothetical protein